MSGIQLILITGFIFIGLYFVTRLKKRLLDIVLLFAMITAGIVFALRPNITNLIARDLGVGRGADLIFYISILIFWFVSLKLYARIRKLEQLFTEIIRKDALANVNDLNNEEALEIKQR
jgi:hypothetical protein